jgi:membrane protein
MVRKQIKFIAGTIKQAVNEFLADNCTHLSAAISYYILLSLFPLALAAITILGYFSRSPDIGARVSQAIADVLPVSGQVVSDTIEGVSQGWGAAGAIAVIGLLWSGLGFFGAVRKSLNTAWGIKQPRPFLRERLMEFLMMLGLGALLIISLGLTAAFKVIQAANISVFGHLISNGLLWHAIVILTSVAITFVVFLLLYKFVPNTRVRWRHVWVGALVAAALVEIAKNVFVWFLGHFATYNLVYGSVSTIIALMVWSYISAMILLFCAKLISVFIKMRPLPAAETLLVVDDKFDGLDGSLKSPLLEEPETATGKQADIAGNRDEPDRKARLKPKVNPSKADLRFRG